MMEATPDNSRDPLGGTTPPGEEHIMDSDDDVSYDSDFDMIDDSEDSDFYLETEESEDSSSDDALGDTESEPLSHTSRLRARAPHPRAASYLSLSDHRTAVSTEEGSFFLPPSPIFTQIT